MKAALTPEDFTKVNHDRNGNPRYVCHFLAFINEGDELKTSKAGMRAVSGLYDLAIRKAKTIGGRKYHNKRYDGGIVFQSYNTNDEIKAISELREVNTDFIKEWTPKQFKQAEKAIYRHFICYGYQWQPTHDKASRKKFNPFNYEEISNTLGLAYTSTGTYAGLWVCNGGYLMANDTHHFTGFAINVKGQVIGIVEDENENPIFIEL